MIWQLYVYYRTWLDRQSSLEANLLFWNDVTLDLFRLEKAWSPNLAYTMGG